MLNFEFCSPTKIVFGKGVEAKVGQMLKEYGATKVLFHYGGGSIKKIGLYDTVVKSLNDAGIGFVELSGVQPNPRVSLVREGIALCRKEGVDFLLAVGGGSVIDSTKGIGVGLKYDGDVWDLYDGTAVAVDTVPVATILTLPAAGSEASNSSVLTNDENGMKRGCNVEINRPKFSLLNPEMCYTLPKHQIANGAADIMAHAMERYFTNTKHVELSDRMTEGLIKTVYNNAPKAIANPRDYEAQAALMWASTLAHNNVLGADKVQDWASHNIEHELSGMFDIAHGAGLAIVFPAWMKYVYKQDIARFCQFANRVLDIEINVFNMEETALKAIEKLESYFASIGLPTRLSHVNIGEDSLRELAKNVKKGNGDGTLGNFVRLDENDCYEILRLCL
ncbi:MAG: iron-containing alcohol dehydrogenase [Christensenellales bacterium]|jgi:alcohol dehydrogenase YqhD (iron-dependent ADH family)